MNLVILVGNLTKDPEVRQAPNGTVVCHLSIAVNKAYKKEGGPDADFFRVTVFGKSAELAERYLSKGRKVGVEGRIENSNYEKDGKTVYQDQIIANRIEFLSPKGEGGSSFGATDRPFGGYQDAPSVMPATPVPQVPDAFASLSDEEDDLPF